VLGVRNEGGCDNVWRLNLTTREATPLTEEPYRFVSSAQWHPSGDRFVGVRWHTTTRSIPAGEVWLFDLDPAGSDRPVVRSERLVGRSTGSTQVGPEEPTFSPDGQYVYYSQNTADGATFNYNKDPHAGTSARAQTAVRGALRVCVWGGGGGAARRGGG
jgi:Tol biopolymer transport system component